MSIDTPAGGPVAESRIDLTAIVSDKLRAMIEALGYEATLKLCRAWGGTEIRPPRDPARSQRFVALIGLDATRKFAQLYHDEGNVYIPKADKLVALLRDRAMAADLDSGKSVTAIARRHNLSRQWTIEILSRRGRDATDDTQGDLFE